MTLAYPIAASGTDALTEPKGLARTKAAARQIAGQPITFETEWLRPGPERAQEWQSAVQMAIGHGAVQLYESEKGRPIIAISYWKLVDETEDAAPVVPVSPPAGDASPDHADDLYFRKGRTAKKGKVKAADPNQLDLFRGPGPDQRGYEHEDPNNPDVILTDEGDDTAFGIAPKTVD